MICPPDVLCEWLHDEGRWETMEELALALEEESLNTIGGRIVKRRPGRPKSSLPKPITKVERTDYEKWLAAKKRKFRNMQQATFRIEHMMACAFHKKSKRLA